MSAIAQIIAQNEVAAKVAAADKAPAKAKKAAAKPVAKEEVKAESKAAPKARTTRPAQKPVEKKTSAVVKAAPVLAVKFRILDGARPTAGRALFAHTQAVIELLQLDKKAVTRAQLSAILGTTAVAHHLKGGRFELTEAGIKLSAFGVNFFNGRAMKKEFDPQDVNDFRDVLTSGKTNRVCKNQTNIAAMKD